LNIDYGENKRQHYCILRSIQESDCIDQADHEYKKRKQSFFISDLLRYGIKPLIVDEYKEVTEILWALEKQYRRNTVFISGASHDYSPYTENESHKFVCDLSKRIVEAKFNIVSGFGVGIGSDVITGALEHIYMNGETIRGKQLVLCPFPQHKSSDKDLKTLWTEYRNDMISFSGIALFLFGNKLVGNDVEIAHGLREEFDISKEKGLFLLPVILNCVD
jgi:hypothetical protein